MKILRITAIAVVLIFIGALVIMPRNMDVEVEREIDIPVETVYRQVVFLQNWIEWSPWALADSTILFDYKQGNTENFIGGEAEWSTLLPNSSDGKYVVVDAKLNEYVEVDVYIYKVSKEEKSYTFKFEFESQGEVGASSTKVKWSMSDTASFFKIQERISIPALVEEFTKQFKEGLENLSKFSREMELYDAFPRLDIQENKMTHFLYIEVEGEAKREDIEKNYTKLAKEVFEFTMQQKLQFREPPLIKIPLWDEKNNKSILQYGFSISPEQRDQIEDILPENMKVEDIASPRLIVAELFIPDKPIDFYYEKLHEYIEFKNLSIVGDRLERYMSNPDVPNMPKHIIIMYPVMFND